MKQLSTLALLFITFTTTQAQDFPYTLTIFEDYYVALDDATMATGSEPWDDPEATIPIGFDFEFFGQTTDHLNLGLGTGGILTTDQDASGIDGIVVYGSDIIDIGYGDTTSISTISYTVLGDFPSRIFVMDWHNVGFYSEVTGPGTSGNRTNFQLWLYEGTYDIEIRFGSNSIKTPELIHDFGQPFIGFIENLNDLYETVGAIYFLTGESETATVGMIDDFEDIYFTEFLMNEPQNGIVYHFDSGLVNVDETKELKAQVYPTIVDEIATISTPVLVNYELISLTGKRIAQGQAPAGKSQLSLTGLAQGMYMLQLNEGSRNSSHRLIKQ